MFCILIYLYWWRSRETLAWWWQSGWTMVGPSTPKYRRRLIQPRLRPPCLRTWKKHIRSILYTHKLHFISVEITLLLWLQCWKERLELTHQQRQKSNPWLCQEYPMYYLESNVLRKIHNLKIWKTTGWILVNYCWQILLLSLINIAQTLTYDSDHPHHKIRVKWYPYHRHTEGKRIPVFVLLRLAVWHCLSAHVVYWKHHVPENLLEQGPI